MDKTYGLKTVSRRTMENKGLLEWTADPDQLRFTPAEIRSALERKARAKVAKKLKRNSRR